MLPWNKRLAVIAASPFVFAAAATGAAKLRDLWIHPRERDLRPGHPLPGAGRRALLSRRERPRRRARGDRRARRVRAARHRPARSRPVELPREEPRACWCPSSCTTRTATAGSTVRCAARSRGTPPCSRRRRWRRSTGAGAAGRWASATQPAPAAGRWTTAATWRPWRASRRACMFPRVDDLPAVRRAGPEDPGLVIFEHREGRPSTSRRWRASRPATPPTSTS